MKKYWLVFVDSPARYLRFLRPGFRHLFLAGHENGCWFSVEILTTGVDFCTAEPMLLDSQHIGCWDVNVIKQRFEDAENSRLQWWWKQGYTAVPVHPTKGRRSFMGILNCVGLAKRFLGIRAPWVITPHALYMHLVKTTYGKYPGDKW